MKKQPVKHDPLWATMGSKERDKKGLDGELNVDVCVVGAGIAGLSVAYHLARSGQKVAVLDDGPVGGGQTTCTTAHLANALDDRYFEIERLHGEEGARLTAESHTAAIHRIDAIVKAERIRCDFERLDGYLFAGPQDSSEILEREFEATHRAGLCDVQLVGASPAASFRTGMCLKFPRQAQFHPLKYLRGLARAIQRDGGQIFNQTHVTEIEGGANVSVKVLGGGIVRAGSIVVATNTPINDLMAIHTKQAPYTTFVVAIRLPVGTVPAALYWDTADPYHYVRIHRYRPIGTAKNKTPYDVLLVGGEDHKTGQADDADQRYERLIAWAHDWLATSGPIETRWSGQVMETIDGLAFIGRNPLDYENVYIATGDSGMGMTHGTIAGMLITDLILGNDNPWAQLYDPARKTLGAAWQFAKENLNVATRYAQWLPHGEATTEEAIEPDSGGIVRRGLQQVAVYRDEHGQLHEFSAACPHLGCVVHWNGDEKSWDCPCHGSRFDCYGQVINGPANTNLAPAEHVPEPHGAGHAH
jgi:glycine/D-amino acid oxidase-like deaminating enzyme/nitrite reductase/ring-hydroxylating ferredoxin subunit